MCWNFNFLKDTPLSPLSSNEDGQASSGLIVIWKSIIWGFLLAMGICLTAWHWPGLLSYFGVAETITCTMISLTIGIYAWIKHPVLGKLWIIVAISASLWLIGGVNLALGLASSNIGVALMVDLVTILFVAVIIDVPGHHITVARLVNLLTILFRGEITSVPNHQDVNPIKRVGPLGLAILCVTAFLVIARWFQSQSGLVPSAGNSVWNVIILGFPFFVPFGITWYRRLIDKEKKIGKEEEPGRELEEVFWATWLPMIFMLWATITASLELAVVAHITSPLSLANNVLRIQYSLMLVGLVVAIGFALFAVHGSSRGDEGELSKDELWTSHPSHPGTSNHPPDSERKTRPELAFQPGASTTLLLIGGVAAWALWPWVSTIITIGSVDLSGSVSPRWLPQWLFYALGVLGALWLGFITVDTMHVHIARYEFYRFAWRAWLVSIACGTAIASTWIWLWIIGIWANGEWASVVEVVASTCIVSFGGALVTGACAWALARSFLRRRKGTDATYLALHYPVANIFQDQVLYAVSLAILLFTALVVDSLRTMKGIHIGAVTLICALISLLMTLAMVIPAFISSIKTTEKHIDREAARSPSKAMYERVGSCNMCVKELKQERLKRIKKRWNYLCYSSLLVLPIGLLLVVPLFIDRINRYFSSSED